MSLFIEGRALSAKARVLRLLPRLLLQGAAHSGTVVSLAAGEEGFGTLVAALEATGLNDTLSEAGPFTVFAPSDSAFVALLTEKAMDAAALLARDDLASILTYHVVPGKVRRPNTTLIMPENLDLQYPEEFYTC